MVVPYLSSHSRLLDKLIYEPSREIFPFFVVATRAPLNSQGGQSLGSLAGALISAPRFLLTGGIIITPQAPM